jgi:hypothetical protein
MLPIDWNQQGRREIHPTSIYRIFRRWQASGCIDAIFLASVRRLQQDQLLDLSISHGDGTTTAARKCGDNPGFSGHKKLKGCKVVAFCDRRCNVIAPFVVAPGNYRESPMLREALPTLMKTAREAGLALHGTIVSLDGAYDCRVNRKAIFNRGMVPNINPTREAGKSSNAAARRCSSRPFLKSASIPSSGCSAAKTSSGACCFASSGPASCTMR